MELVLVLGLIFPADYILRVERDPAITGTFTVPGDW